VTAKTPKPCREPGCDYPKWGGKQRCFWHFALSQPIAWQIAKADARLAEAGTVHLARVRQEEWPPGERWCAGCQSFVPLFYCSGSRCKACSSRAAHAAHIRREYGIEPDVYDSLLQWQGGRCYICRRVPRTRRLAVDHDHDTGEVRGLLCADNDRGCNHAILGNITSLDMARRIVEYLEKPPLRRMRAGEPRPAGLPEVQRRGIQIRALPRAPESPQDEPAEADWTQDPAWQF